MKFIVLLAFIYCAVNNVYTCVNATNTTEPKKLKVEVFYETLCPDSKWFIREQLYKSIKSNEWLPFIDLEFIPYGKVKSVGQLLFCQHGHLECELNAQHACIVEHNTIEEQLEMFNCMLNDYSNHVDKCSENLHIDVTAAKNCKENRTVVEILKKYGDKTNAINITFVPSIGIGEVFDREEQNEILHNFSSAFCRKYKENFDVTLEKC